MTVAEYVVRYLRDQGINKVFAIQGGGSARLIDAIGSTEGIEYICNQHEQASAMSADGYARVTGKIGCALSTSGPGATNLLTGVGGAFFDSIPILFITGQVSSFRLKGNINVRCMHTQETDIVDMSKTVTKYAVALKNPYDIRYELEKCLFIAKEGRPGPVIIDIPDDYQREEIEENKLRSFYDGSEYKELSKEQKFHPAYIKELSDLINNAKYPIIIGGWGIHCSKAENQFIEFIEQLNIPVVFTWGGQDIIPEDHYLKVGTLGMNGSIAGNMAVRKADLLIIVGARLDQHTVIVPLKDFIDQEDIRKFESQGSKLDLSIQEDIKRFIQNTLQNLSITEVKDNNWLNELMSIKREASNKSGTLYKERKDINPYRFFHILSNCMEENAIVFIDTGSSLVWTEQAFHIKKGQRLHSSSNNTPMGYSLPAAIGAAIATRGRVYSINGDGGLQMNLQELATIIRHNLDIKIILFDNAGYGMIQRTQDTYMGSRYEGSNVASGLAFPDFEKLFGVYGFHVTVIESETNYESQIISAFRQIGPGCIIVKVSMDESFETFNREDIAL